MLLLYYLIFFRSLTYAQRAVRLLENAGVPAMIVRPPMGLSVDGCSHSLKLRGSDFLRAETLLKNAGIKHGVVFLIGTDGRTEEVVT